MTFRLATPQERQRMSWYQRARYDKRRRAYLLALDAERPEAEQPKAERPIATAQLDLLRVIIEALATELDQIGRATKRKPKPAPELKPCGTVAAYRRHKRHGEDPCPECQAAERRRAADRRAAARTRRSAA